VVADINAEHLAMRDRAAMVDLSAFAIFDITGPGALDVVQGLALRQMDVAVGRAVYTPLLTPTAAFRSDLTIMRLDEQQFRVVTGGRTAWPTASGSPTTCPPTARPQLHDQTSAWCTLGLWGPRARETSPARRATTCPTRASRSPAARTIELGSLRVLGVADLLCRRSRLELYVPIEQARGCGISSPKPGRRTASSRRHRRLRHHRGLEKCYRAYGFELDGEFNVVEAGMAGPKVKDEPFRPAATRICAIASRSRPRSSAR